MAKNRTAEKQEALNKQLLDAAHANNLAGITQALKDGADVNAEDEKKLNSLHRVAWYGNAEAVKVVLEAGAEINALNDHQYTPLHWAADSNRTDVAEILLAAGADLTLKNTDGTTPIHNARNCKHSELAEYMQAIGEGTKPRPTPQEVGLDMKKRNAALTGKLIVGKHTAKALAGMEAQRQAALNDPSEGI